MRVLISLVIQIAAIAAVDFYTQADITLWLFYIVPIGLTTWNCGYRFGAIAAALGSAAHLLTWFAAPSPAPGLGALVVLVSRCAVFALVVFLVAALRAREVERVVQPKDLQS